MWVLCVAVQTWPIPVSQVYQSASSTSLDRPLLPPVGSGGTPERGAYEPRGRGRRQLPWQLALRADPAARLPPLRALARLHRNNLLRLPALTGARLWTAALSADAVSAPCAPSRPCTSRALCACSDRPHRHPAPRQALARVTHKAVQALKVARRPSSPPLLRQLTGFVAEEVRHGPPFAYAYAPQHITYLTAAVAPAPAPAPTKQSRHQQQQPLQSQQQQMVRPAGPAPGRRGTGGSRACLR